jgi:D-amino peptidase
MRVYVSADIEGVGGVATWDQAGTDRPDHHQAREWMTEDVNAAVEGAFSGGAEDVVVRDAHGRARNIIWDRLHPRARLISGWGPTIDMLLGLDANYGLVMLIGYHPGPEMPCGVLSHTFSSRIHGLTLNGLPCNEVVIAALEAGVHGIPVGMVSGQAELMDEIRPTLPDVRFAATKQGLAYQAAILAPPTEVRATIRDSAREAVARAIARKEPSPFQPAGGLRLDFELTTVEAAEAILGIEGCERTGPRSCSLLAPGAALLLSRFFSSLQILYSIKDTP